MNKTALITPILLSAILSPVALSISLPGDGSSSWNVPPAPPTPPAPPATATKSLSIYSPLGDKVKIYANGNMQAKLIVKYDLNDGYHNPIIKLKQKDLGIDLPSGWTVSSIENDFDHTIGYASKTILRSSTSQATEVKYVTSREVDYMDICVELTAEHDNYGKVTDTTCDESTNRDSILVDAKRPIVYTNDDFNVEYTNKTNNKKLTIKNYSISPKSELKNIEFTVGNGHLRGKSEDGNVYSNPKNAKMLQVNSNGSYIYFAEFLPKEMNNYTTSYKISDPWSLDILFDSNTLFNLSYGYGKNLITTHTTNECIRWGFRPLPTGGGYQRYCREHKKVTTKAWPMPLTTTHRKSHNIHLIDNYGTSHTLNFQLKDGNLYYGINKVQ
ncbi:hypothetical protein [Vibrio jasicida]|uniref:hypothetical protein n=1 Tax=Vibrio jasicida TaxID=766224 RepID=UPI000CE30628|nr:hypothetical protein [Vibrio jasicida]